MKINRLDKYIADLYISLGINKVDDLTIENLSHKFKIKSRYYDLDSFILRDEEVDYIFINHKNNELKQRFDFFHELAHYILDHYSSSNELLVGYFEGKADTLTEYLAIPLHLLQRSEIDIDDPNYVQKISEEFGMEFDFTFNRLNKLKDLRR